jgi:hypothetical protein
MYVFQPKHMPGKLGTWGERLSSAKCVASEDEYKAESGVARHIVHDKMKESSQYLYSPTSSRAGSFTDRPQFRNGGAPAQVLTLGVLLGSVELLGDGGGL